MRRSCRWTVTGNYDEGLVEVRKQRMKSKAMKLKINVPAATSLGVALLFVLGGAGCASSGNHAMVSHCAQCLTVGAQSNSQDSLAQDQSWRFSRASAVSPLGDAPAESDLALTREWLAEGQYPCAGCAAGVAQTASVR